MLDTVAAWLASPDGVIKVMYSGMRGLCVSDSR